MLDDETSPMQQCRRRRLPYLLIVIALTLLGRNEVSAQWGQKVEPQLLVEFRLTLTPDKEAEALGAVPLTNQVGMAGRLWQDRFTGGGCIPGTFEPAIINLWSLSKGDGHPFEVSCRSRSKDDKISLIEWKGNLENGKISGDVWITLPGTPLTAEQVLVQKQVDRDRARQKVPAVTINGKVVFEEVTRAKIEEVTRKVDVKNVLLPAQGRRLHFTFTTAEVVIIPLGTWSERTQPGTKPSDVSRRDR